MGPLETFDLHPEPPVVDALIAIAVAAAQQRTVTRECGGAGVRAFAAELLSEALDLLQVRSPALFDQFGSEDALWLDELRGHCKLGP